LGDAKAELLLDLGEDGAAKRAFERDFSDAWRVALASPNGANLRQYLVSEEEEARPEALRELLLDNTASWRRQHVFATVDDLGDFPEMPLEDAYIAPLADVVVNEKSVNRGEKVLGLLEGLIPNNPITFVSADMGHGKSLTARTLAWKYAQKARSEQESVSPEMWWPVYVRCADDFLRSTTNDVEGIIKRALKRQALALGKELGLDDPALSKFPQEQRILLLLDGLDEVSVAGKELTALLESLRGWSSPKRRCVIFSRPAALPDRRKDIPVVKIRKFESEQVEAWLKRWARFRKRPGPTPGKLAKMALEEIVSVPILLLMVAYSWDQLVGQEHVRKADIYELFFRDMAWGKFRHSEEDHPEIQRGARSLYKQLSNKKLLVEDPTASEQTRLVDGMLWLMGRVAWEAKCCEFEAKWSGGSPDLRRSRIETKILEDELQCSPEDLHCVQIGLLLASQADLRNESHSSMLFGHRSFLEFLVARYWYTSLQLHVNRQGRAQRSTIERQLMRAPLRMDEEDKCDSFLYEMLETSAEKRKIGDWAADFFLDERLLAPDGEPVTFTGDRRTRLRGAALGIACQCGKHPILETSHVLRSLLAWASVRDEFMHVHARGLKLAKHKLPRSNFTGADLSAANMDAANLRFSSFVEASLREASLRGVDLFRAHLFRGDLRGADLFRGDLREADLRGADLTGANLREADLFRVDLREASLREADLTGAHLFRGDLTDADLRGADLTGAHLFRADLTGTDLRGANLRGADLTGADLFRGDLREADLREADLRVADLTGADLTGANLREADLFRVDLRNTKLDKAKLQEARLTPDQRAYAQAQGAILDDESDPD